MYLLFCTSADGNILSYVRHEKELDAEGNWINKPSKEKCAGNNNLSEDEIGFYEWTKEEPQPEDFKDNINDLDAEDLEEIQRRCPSINGS